MRLVRRAVRSKQLCEQEGMATKRDPGMRRTDASVEGFLAAVPNERRREDTCRLCVMMQEITGEPPTM